MEALDVGQPVMPNRAMTSVAATLLIVRQLGVV
jgi:hypothetical protein